VAVIGAIVGIVYIVKSALGGNWNNVGGAVLWTVFCSLVVYGMHWVDSEEDYKKRVAKVDWKEVNTPQTTAEMERLKTESQAQLEHRLAGLRQREGTKKRKGIAEMTDSEIDEELDYPPPPRGPSADEGPIKFPISDGGEKGNRQGNPGGQAGSFHGGSGKSDQEIAEAVFQQIRVWPSWWDPIAKKRK